jgi:CHAT domain-containing protein
VVRLPDEKELAGKLRMFSRLLSAPSKNETSIDDEFAGEIGHGVSKLIFGQLTDLIASRDRLLFAPDGVLNLLPLSALPDPGRSDGSSREECAAMIACKEVVRIPSATLLAWRREVEEQPGTGEDLRILAVAAERSESGEALPGATDEVRALEARYRGVESIIVSPVDSPVSVPDILANYDLLHLAAHARAEDQSPWRSTIRFSATDEQCNPRADRIAAMHLPARLAVLSSCESARGRIVSGEGVQGLSSAFLSAGIPTVVATLWAVDDRSTARLMEQFYEQLADGKTVARALQMAQNHLRQAEHTRHPYFWAGFVLVGDGQVRVNLDRRGALDYRWILALLVLAVLVLLARRGLTRPGRGGRDRG